MENQSELAAEIAKAMHETAPLYEGMTGLREWLRQSGGIIFGECGGFWAAKTRTPDGRWIYAKQCMSFSEMLQFALEHAEKTIRSDALGTVYAQAQAVSDEILAATAKTIRDAQNT